jgi:hypothetical protein
MIERVCHLLFHNQQRDWWLIAFDDAEQGLTPDKPVYLPADAITRFQPVDELSGELYPPGLHRFGQGVITLAPQVWANTPNLVAAKLKAKRRAEAAEAALHQKKLASTPRIVRRSEDRMLRARRLKAQGTLDL